MNKLLLKIIQATLLYKIYASIKWLYIYARDYNYVAETFYSDQFSYVLKRYLNVDFKKDWIGRLYAVINPLIDIDGKMNFNNVIIELDDTNTNNNDYVKSWVMKQMSMINALFKLENSGFFDIIGVKFKHVGPKNQDNYLVIFDICSRLEFTSYIKKTIIHGLIYGAIIACLLLSL